MKTEIKKIIITGANGNVGKAVTKKLIDNGSYVIAVVENEVGIQGKFILIN